MICIYLFLYYIFILFICMYIAANVLRTCHRSDPNLNDCIKEAIEDLRPYLANGKV